jgi:hypothetical protein
MRRTIEGETGWKATAARCALAAFLGLAALSAACAGGEPDAGELSPAELGTLGGRIHQQPERAEEILAEAGLTAEELEERVREVTADPDAARAYAEGFRAASGEEPDAGATADD